MLNKSDLSSHNLELIDFLKIEGICVFWLVSNSISVRSGCLKILDWLRSTCRVLKKTSSYVQRTMPSSLMTMLESLFSDWTQLDIRVIDQFNSSEEDGISNKESLCCVSELEWDWSPFLVCKDSAQYSAHLGELVRAIAAWRRESLSRLYDICESRISAFCAESTKSLRGVSPEEHILWRNVAIVLCSSMHTDLAWFEGARERNDRLVTQMFALVEKSTSRELVCLFVSALGSCPWSFANIIYENCMLILDSGLDALSLRVGASVEHEITPNPAFNLRSFEKRQKLLLRDVCRILRMTSQGLDLSETYAKSHFNYVSFIQRLSCLIKNSSSQIESLISLPTSEAIAIIELVSDFSILIRNLQFLSDGSQDDFFTTSTRFNLFLLQKGILETVLKQMQGSIATSSLSKSFSLSKSRLNRQEKQDKRTHLLKTCHKSILKSMSSLLRGPLFDASQETHDSLYGWINHTLQFEKEEIRDIGSVSIKNILLANPGLMLEQCLSHCYSSEFSVIRKRYFLVLGDLWIRNEIRIKFPELLILVITKLGDFDRESRTLALDMLPIISERKPGSLSGHDIHFEVLTSDISDSFHHTQRLISSKLSREYAHYAKNVIHVLWKRLLSISKPDQIPLLRCCSSWIEQLDFSRDGHKSLIDLLVCVTERFGDSLGLELECIWKSVSFSGKSCNIQAFIKYFLDKLVEHQSAPQSALFLVVKKICVYFSRSSREQTLSFLVEKVRTKLSGQSFLPLENAEDDPDQSLDPQSELRLLQGDYSVALLVEIAFELDLMGDSCLYSSLAQFFHVGTVCISHHHEDIRNAGRSILMNVLHAIAFKEFESAENRPDQMKLKAKALMDHLVRFRDSFSPNSMGSFSSSQELGWEFGVLLSTLDSTSSEEVRKIVHSLISNADFLEIDQLMSCWGEISLHWAVSTGSLFASVKSHQIYRALCILMRVDNSCEILQDLLSFLEPAYNSEKEPILIETLCTMLLLVQRIETISSDNVPIVGILFWQCTQFLQHNLSPLMFVACCDLLDVVFEKIPPQNLAISVRFFYFNLV